MEFRRQYHGKRLTIKIALPMVIPFPDNNFSLLLPLYFSATFFFYLPFFPPSNEDQYHSFFSIDGLQKAFKIRPRPSLSLLFLIDSF